MEARAVRARAAMVFVVFLGEINRRRLRTVIYTLYCMCSTEYDVKVRVQYGGRRTGTKAEYKYLLCRVV